nr:hypothetical protein CFP56_20089 [Quercus suber]
MFSFSLVYDMEDLALRWKQHSLTEAEGRNVDLTKEKKKLKFVIAAKFFTFRSLNLEAMANIFRPLWQIRGNFEVSDGGNNVLLTAFELEVDVEKVLQGEPWVFDRHLVAIQRYGGSIPIHELHFEKSIFYV